jgi:hypothetical protein
MTAEVTRRKDALLRSVYRESGILVGDGGRLVDTTNVASSNEDTELPGQIRDYAGDDR